MSIPRASTRGVAHLLLCFTPNRSSEARELELGNDLVLIDWREPRVLSRTDLGALDALGTSASAAAPFVQAGAAFVLGDGAYDPETSLVLLPDADRRAIRRFAIGDDGSHRELDAIETAPCRGLPPREVRRLRAP